MPKLNFNIQNDKFFRYLLHAGTRPRSYLWSKTDPSFIGPLWKTRPYTSSECKTVLSNLTRFSIRFSNLVMRILDSTLTSSKDTIASAAVECIKTP